MTDVERFRLSLLHPAMRARAEGIVQRMRQRGFREPYIGSTYRTLDEQMEAVKRGTTGRKQTLSWHLIKRAVDFRDRLPSGKPDPTTRNELFFLALWEEATMAGCRSLGYVRDTAGHPIKYYINGGKVWDAGHVEYREPYKSLVDAVAMEAPHLLDVDPEDDPDDVIAEDLVPLPLGVLPKSPFT
jgi:hypothetical protein